MTGTLLALLRFKHSVLAEIRNRGGSPKPKWVGKMVQHGAVIQMDSYRPSLPQSVDPLEHLYQLERDLEASERRNIAALEDMARRIGALEEQVSSMNTGLSQTSVHLEREVLALAERLQMLENTKAA